MIVFTTAEHDGVLVVEIDGELDPDGPALLAGHLEELRRQGPIVVHLSHLDDPTGPTAAELLWRLESCVGSDGLALVHDDLGERRSLRARTTIPVLPTTGAALHGYARTSLDRRSPRHADRQGVAHGMRAAAGRPHARPEDEGSTPR